MQRSLNWKSSWPIRKRVIAQQQALLNNTDHMSPMGRCSVLISSLGTEAHHKQQYYDDYQATSWMVTSRESKSDDNLNGHENDSDDNEESSSRFFPTSVRLLFMFQHLL